MTQDSKRPEFELSVTLGIPFSDAKAARAAIKALIPDNVNMPKGLSIAMSSKGSLVSIAVCADKVQMSTIVNTVDEILEHISVARKLTGAAKDD
jgi:hypothetical protein